jgi:beta-lactamase class A
MQEQRNKKLKENLEYLISRMQEIKEIDAEIKISVYDLESGVSANVGGDSPGWAASTIKLPIMVDAIRQIGLGTLSLNSKIRTDHGLILEPYDFYSKVEDGTMASLSSLLYYMMVQSDNTATNMIARRLGIPNINRTMKNLGMKRSMLGHLLCRGAKRYRSYFNRDGSNITTPNDMVRLMRQIYDSRLHGLSRFERNLARAIMAETSASYLNKGPFKDAEIHAKVGFIHDSSAGLDVHETGIINNHLIVSVMLNKIDQNKIKNNLPIEISNEFFIPSYSSTPINDVYELLMRAVGREFGYGQNPKNALA